MFYEFNQTSGWHFFKDAAALVPAYERVLKSKIHGENAVKWLFAIHDPKSPFQDENQEEVERIKKVNKHFFKKGTSPYDDDPLMKAAFDALKDTYWDESFIQLQAINRKIKNETKKLDKFEDSDDIITIVKSLKELNELKVSVKDAVQYKLKTGVFDNVKFKPGQKPSMLTKSMEEEKMSEKSAFE